MTPPIPYLTTQLETARAILFTGAGFSMTAKNVNGEPMPSAGRLKEELWKLCFPDAPFDSNSTLQSVYEAALMRNARETKELLTALLSVDGNSLPEWYSLFFKLPWFKCYTLNIDDLAQRLGNMVWLPRKIEPVSGVRDRVGNTESDKDILRIVHLNGTIQDLPKDVTFSTTQYAERLARQEPVYTQLSAELLSHPFVFIGTTLDESLLWQHIQLRSTRGGSGLGEFRRKSFLVTPHLDKAREVALSQYNVEWIPMNAEHFATEVLSKLEGTIPKGINVISKRSAGVTDNESIIQEVSTLIGGPMSRTEFLLGTEPIWSDIQSGRAITRNSDDDLWNKVSDVRKGKGARGFVLVTGTAGSGKSTALMRIALHLSSDGTRVGWVDRDSEVSLRGIRRAFQNGTAPDVIVIDDADLLGIDLGPMLREICLNAPYPFFVLGIRSGRVDRILNPAQLGQTPSHEYTMPLLTDEDIAGLIDALTNDNKLGKLRGLTRIEQENALREKTGRELLVAMIEATSGLRFEEKAVKEYEELDEDKKRIYAIVATATALQFSLSKKDILIAVGRQDNAVLNALDQLVRRNIILTTGGAESSYRARHRVLGEIVERKLQSAGQLYDVIRGLLIVVATQVTPEMPRGAKPKRLLVRLINNSFLHRMLGPEQARNLYGELESHLNNESHYWLQRGVLEVEAGNLRLAKNWLDQAKGISPDDNFVENEYALWEFRTALETPADLKSRELVDDACNALEHQIALNGKRYDSPYHILGSQCLAWVRRGLKQFEEQRDFLEYGTGRVKEGVQNHPTNDKLKSLLKEMEDEKLNLVLRR